MFDTLIVIQPTVLVGSTDAAMFISLLATPEGNYTIGEVSAANPLHEVVIPAPGCSTGFLPAFCARHRLLVVVSTGLELFAWNFSPPGRAVPRASLDV